MVGSAGRLAVLVVVLIVGGVAGVTAGDSGAAAVQPPQQVDIDADSVSLRADVGADGTADWTVTYRIRLDDDNATAAFEELQADIADDPAPYVDPFRQRMERTVAAAENATGREMAVREVTVETSRESQPQVEYGVVTYQLTWTNFAAVDGETVRAGDAVDALFLDSQTALQLSSPEGYVVDTASPEPTRTDATEVVWQGQRDFDGGEPRAVFVPESGTPAGDGGAGTATPTPTGTTTEAGGGEGSGGLPLVPLAVLVAMLALGGVWIATRGGVTLPTEGDDEDSGPASAASVDDSPPPELLSNEERVLQLLEGNGGRMKQKEVAERLDWTAAKTSQVVGDLRDEDRVEAFRLGRENVLTLPDVDIEGGEDGSDDE